MEVFCNKDKLEVGVDEAGRGPLFGRVYAAAVIWDPDKQPEVLITDSKKLNNWQLEKAYSYIKEHALAYGVSYSTESDIKNLNILNATLQAMHRAISMCQLEPDLILVDGNRFDPYFSSRGEMVDAETVINGDARYISIAAASILAKVERDRYVLEMCEAYPDLNERYDLASNKGYASARHREGIKKYGISQFHRVTFGCCKSAEVNEVHKVIKLNDSTIDFT